MIYFNTNWKNRSYSLLFQWSFIITFIFKVGSKVTVNNINFLFVSIEISLKVLKGSRHNRMGLQGKSIIPVSINKMILDEFIIISLLTSPDLLGF